MAEQKPEKKPQPTAPMAAFQELGTMRPGAAPPGVPAAPISVSDRPTVRATPAAGVPAVAPLTSDSATMRPGAAPPAPAPAPALTADSATIRPGSAPPPVTSDSATIRPVSGGFPVSPHMQTGVIPGSRVVDREAHTIRADGGTGTQDFAVTADSGTIASDRGDRIRAARVAGAPGIERLGPYRVVKELGRGGMGVVYKAHHETLNRDVALKVMLGAHEAGEQDIRRFLREAEACAQLKHPNIVPVFDISDQQGSYYFAMEFVEGVTLLDWSKKVRREIPEVIAIMRKVCDALAYAHQRGIIHRDLKPHNVMIDPKDEPKVMDFGLAKRTDAQKPGAEKTVVGTIMGTPQYMPPEQATGRIDEVDTRSDVYALGVMIYELVAGELPIDAPSFHELLYKIENYEPPPLRERRLDCPWEIEVIVAKAMAKEKAQRFQSAQELADDLRRWERKEPILARKASLAYRARKFVQRNRTLTAMVATGTLVAAIGGYGVWKEVRKQQVAAKLRLDGLFSEAKREVAAVDLDLRAYERDAPSQDAKDILDRMMLRLRPTVDRMKASILAAETEAEAKDDPRIDALATAASNIGNRYGSLEKTVRERFDREHESVRRRDEAAHLVAEATAACASVAPEKVDSGKAGDDAGAVLAGARERLFKALGLDAESADAKRELAALIELEKRVAAVVAKLRDVELYKDALAEGRRRLAAARQLAWERDLVDVEGTDAEAISNAFIDAALAFEKALGYENDSAEAKAGIVDATLDDASAALAASSDFGMARRAARKVEALAPERVRRFREDLQRAEASSARFQKLVADGRAERTRGNFASALASFDEAVQLAPADRELIFAAALCRARVACVDKRHLDELALVEKAAKLAPGAAETAEADAERERVAKELLDEAERALDARRPEVASEIVARLLEVRPDDAGARRLKVELAGRSRVLPGFVFVSEGAFHYSLAPGTETEVPAFLIGETEVTNAEFARFVAAGGYTDAGLRRLWPEEGRALLEAKALTGRDGAPGPADWVGAKPLPGSDDLPVAGVSWYEATAYAAWRAQVERAPFRLPSEAEWEKAAVYDRSGRREVAPWTPADWDRFWSPYFDRIDGAKAVKTPLGKGPDGAPLLDKSPCGAYDMYGNVHEWIAERAPDGRAILRGGSFLSRLPDRAAPTCRKTPRPDYRAEIVGFRLATAAPE